MPNIDPDSTIGADGKRYAQDADDIPRSAQDQLGELHRIKGRRPGAPLEPFSAGVAYNPAIAGYQFLPDVQVVYADIDDDTPDGNEGDLIVVEGADPDGLIMYQFNTKTGNVGTTSTSTAVTGTGFKASNVGAKITGAGIPAGTTVAAVTDATHLTLSAAATATATVPAVISAWVAVTGPAF